MSILEKNNHSEVTSVTVPALSIRWWNANCYEFKFPDGTTVLTDPLLPDVNAPEPNFARYACGYTVADLDNKIDYVLINHAHGDHVGNLPEVFERFHPIVMCHSAYAYSLCKDLDIPFTYVIPFDHEQTFDFDSFKVKMHTCRHYSNLNPPSKGGPDKGTRFERLNEYGSLFNTNFVFTTPNNFRISLCAGLFEADERNALVPESLNVLIRQCGTTIKLGLPELLAEQFMATGASVLFPLHHEKCYPENDLNDFVAQVNKILEEKKYFGKMILPQRGKWYTLSVGATME